MNYGFTKEVIESAVNQSYSKLEATKLLGFDKASGTSYRVLKYYVEKYNIDCSHFTARKYKPGEKSPYVKNILLSDRLTINSSIPSHKLKLRLIRDGVFKHECSICGITEWMGKPTPIQLDHINGDNLDNRLENLRILCPNCHAQTDTYCGKNGKVKKPNKEKYIPNTKRPSKEILEQLLLEKPMTQIGKDYNVGCNAVIKWAKYYNLKRPGRGYWQKKQVKEKASSQNPTEVSSLEN